MFRISCFFFYVIYRSVVVGSRKMIDATNGTTMMSEEIMEAATGETAGSNA